MSVIAVLMLLIIAIPVLGAVGITGHSRRTSVTTADRYWSVSVLALGVTTVLTVLLGSVLILYGPTTARVGTTVAIAGYALEVGVTVRSDILSVTIGLLDVILTLGILAYTRTAGPHGQQFHVSYLLFTAAVFVIVFSGDLIGTYVGLLVLIVVTARLIECGEKAGSTTAARNYRRTAIAGATVFFLGVLLSVSIGGSSDAERLGVVLADVGHTEPIVISAFVVMTVGLGSLIALIPLHGWLIEAHANAVDPVSALISGVLPAAAVYAFLRVLFDVFTLEFLAANPTITTGIIYGALVSLLVGNLLAYGQRDIKGMLAYSTISQFGLVVAGLLAATETAIFGSVIQLFGHGLVKGAFCLIAGIIAIRFDARTLDDFGGVADRAPVLAASFAGLAIAMIGLPPTVGFVGKWYIAVGAFEQGLWLVTGFVIFSTLLTLGYVLPFVDRLYFGTFDGTDNGAETISTAMVGVVVAAVVVAFSIGLASVVLESLLREAIEHLVALPS